MPAAVAAPRQSVISPTLPPGREHGRWLSLICFSVPALFALTLALLHNFTWCDIRITLATDGKHYLTTIQKFVEAFSTGNIAGILSAEGPGAHLLLDGPLLALLYLPLFLLSGHIPGPRDWNLLAQGQSLLHAGTAGLVSILVLRVTRNPFWACVAGGLFAAYPPAVLQTGHFMTETPAALLCLVMIWAMSTLKRPLIAPALGGLAAGLLIVSKPALIPAVVIGLFYGCMQFQFRKKAFLAALVAALAVLSSWCALSVCVTGAPSFTARRQPVYNVSKAWNTEFDGWGCNPHPVLTDLNAESDGPLNVTYGMWQGHFEECMRLTARKVTRLFGLPWNDFKNRSLGVDMNGQIFWHQLLLCSGLYGLIFFLTCRYKSIPPAQRLAAELCFILLIGHFAYLLAESTARYAFTAMPLLMILAMVGLGFSGGAEPSERPKVGGVLSCLIAAMLLTSLILHAEKISKRDDPKNLRELSHLLTFGQRAEKTLDFSETTTPGRVQSVLVLVDGDKNLEQCEVLVNGQRIGEHLLPVNHFDGPHYNLYDQMREFAPSMGVNAEEFRQWRAVAVAPELIHWNGKNKIELAVRPAAATIYGDANVDSRFMLSPDYFSYGLVSSAPAAAGAESRCIDPVITGSARQNSRILSGSRAERLFDSLRIKVACVLPPASTTAPRTIQQGSDRSAPVPSIKKSILPAIQETRFHLKIPASIFDPMLQEGEQIRINKTILYSARSIGASIKLPHASQGQSHIKLVITGELKALRNPGETGVLVALTGKDGTVATLGKLPRAIRAGSSWSSFVITDTVPLSLLSGQPDSLAVALYPVPWMEGQYGASRKNPDAAFRNLRVDGEYTALPGIAGTRVIFY